MSQKKPKLGLKDLKALVDRGSLPPGDGGTKPEQTPQIVEKPATVETPVVEAEGDKSSSAAAVTPAASKKTKRVRAKPTAPKAEVSAAEGAANAKSSGDGNAQSEPVETPVVEAEGDKSSSAAAVTPAASKKTKRVRAKPTAPKAEVSAAEGVVEKPEPTIETAKPAAPEAAVTPVVVTNTTEQPQTPRKGAREQARAKAKADGTQAAKQEQSPEQLRLQHLQNADNILRKALVTLNRLMPETHVTGREGAPERLPHLSVRQAEILLKEDAWSPNARGSAKHVFTELRKGFVKARDVQDAYEAALEVVDAAWCREKYGEAPQFDPTQVEGMALTKRLLFQIRFAAEWHAKRDPNTGLVMNTLATGRNALSRITNFAKKLFSTELVREIFKTIPKAEQNARFAWRQRTLIVLAKLLGNQELVAAELVIEATNNLIDHINFLEDGIIRHEKTVRREQFALKAVVQQYLSLVKEAEELRVAVPVRELEGISLERLRAYVAELGKTLKTARNQAAKAAHDREQTIKARAKTLVTAAALEGETLTPEAALAQAEAQIDAEERAAAEAEAKIAEGKLLAELSKRDQKRYEALAAALRDLNTRRAACNKQPVQHGFVDPKDLDASERRMIAAIAEVETLEAKVKAARATAAVTAAAKSLN